MNGFDRLAAWVLRSDPTTACEWSDAEADDLALKYAQLLFEHAALKAELERLNIEADALHQENMQLHAELAEHRLTTDPTTRVPRLHLLPPVADDDWFARLYDERGNVR